MMLQKIPMNDFFKESLFKSIGAEAVPAYLCDLQCRILWASENFYRITGADPQPGGSMLRILAPEKLDDALYQLRRSSSGETHGFTLTCVGGDGKQFKLLTFTFPVALDGGKQGFAGIIAPATDGDTAPLADGLLFRQAAESMASAVAFTDPQGILLWANPAYYRATMTARDTVLGGVAPHVANNPGLLDALQNPALNGEWDLRLGAGNDAHPWLVHISATKSSHAIGKAIWVHSLTDISAWHMQREHLEFMARHDPMTRLPNRVHFSEQLMNALFRARREQTDIAVLFIDLDGFKAINDAAGHAVGDRILQQAAWRMKQVADRYDFVLARLGGDEFAAFIAGSDPLQAATAAAQALRDALNPEFTCDSGNTCLISASIGVAVGRSTAEDLLRRADSAMYQVKELGGDGVHTDPSISHHLHRSPV